MRRTGRARTSILIAVTSVIIGVVLAGCSTGSPSSSGPSSPTSASAAGGSSGSAPASASPPPSSAAPKTPVHIKLLNEDGSTYGVGMPLIAFFSKRITNAAALQQATTVTVGGEPAQGYWYFETSAYLKGYPIEGHFRLTNYWPAHRKIFINIPAKGVSAGGNMAFDDSLTSSWSTGAAHIGVVDDSTHRLTITSDGRHWGTFPVSLGYRSTPTAHGTKVIMEKGRSICMSGPGYHECGVKYTQRLTYGGEYLHSAPWNCTGSSGCVGPQNNIGSSDSSNGCTNLLPSDAARLYGFLRIGDVVSYPNANGPKMSLGAGYGDWNVPTGQLKTGGLVRTTA